MSKNKVFEWKKEELIQAVVIVDSFNNYFTPFSQTIPSCLLPLANRPLLEYTLKCLADGGVNEVILFTSTFPDKIKDFIKERRFGNLVINIVVSEGCRSFGDAIRDLDNKALIRNDFILLTGFLVSNLHFKELFKVHNEFRKQNGQSIALTLLCKDGGSRENIYEKLALAVDAKTKRIIWLHKAVDKTSKYKIPMENLLLCDEVAVHSTFIDSKVYICSLNVPPLFSDNFDFENMDDFIRGLLMNEEILASTMYCHDIGSYYASTVSNWIDYQNVTHDLLRRWVYPVVPDCDNYYILKRNSVYQGRKLSLSHHSILKKDVLIGNGTCIGGEPNEPTLIDCSIIGNNCKIGKNVKLEGCYIFDNVIIEDNCNLHTCVIGSDSKITSGFTLNDGTILGPNVIIDSSFHDSKKTVNGIRLQSSPTGSGDQSKLGTHAFLCDLNEDDSSSDFDNDDENDENPISKVNTGGPGLRISNKKFPMLFQDSVFDEDSSESSESEKEIADDVSEIDDNNIFYNEVLDSLERGYLEKLPCDNLILEINSSRYAYNISLKELNVMVVKAILSLPNSKTTLVDFLNELKERIVYFDPILKKYIKSEDSQKDCLCAIEEVAELEPRVKDILMQLLNFLYNQDLLYSDTIEWWYENPNITEISLELRKKVEKFIIWLKEAESESESEEES